MAVCKECGIPMDSVIADLLKIKPSIPGSSVCNKCASKKIASRKSAKRKAKPANRKKWKSKAGKRKK